MMQVNGVNQAQIPGQMSFGEGGNEVKAQKIKPEASEDTVEIATGKGKPKGLKSWGKGFLTKLTLNVPILGSYLIGKNCVEQDNIQEALASGKKYENKDPGILKSVFRGIGMKLAQIIPFYGTYKVGKEIVEQKNIQEALSTGDGQKAAEKPKFWKAWGEGLKMKLSQIIPIFGTYKIGKELTTHENINKVA